MSDQFDLDAEIASRVEGQDPAEAAEGDPHSVDLEALAVLIDASLSPADRAEGFAQLLGPLLARLGPDESRRFYQLAVERGEYAALVYLTEVTQMP